MSRSSGLAVAVLEKPILNRRVVKTYHASGAEFTLSDGSRQNWEEVENPAIVN
jgi:hypothetical protein